MIKFFSNIKVTNAVFLFLFLIALRVFFLFGYLNVPIDNVYESNYTYYVFSILNNSAGVSFVLCTLIVFFTAVLLNSVIVTHGVLFIRNYLAAYFYCILASIFPEYYILGPALIINLLMVVSFNRLFELYKAPSPIDNIFLIGLLTGLMVLLGIKYIGILIYMAVGITFFRTIKIKEILALFLGFVLPLFMGIFLNYYVNDNFIPAYIELPRLDMNKAENFLFSPLSIIAIMFSLATVRIINNYWRNTIKTRKIISLVYIYLGLAILLALTGEVSYIYGSLYAVLPMSIILAHYNTTSLKLGWIRVSLHWALLLSIVIFQYKFLWS